MQYQRLRLHYNLQGIIMETKRTKQVKIKYVVDGHDLPHGFTTKAEAVKYFLNIAQKYQKITRRDVESQLKISGIYRVFVLDLFTGLREELITKIETWERYREGVIGYNDPVLFAINNEVVET